MFLGSLERLGTIIDAPLSSDARTALDASLRYFREAAPKHTADEEQSLFPRLRQIQRQELDVAVARLDALERDHRLADSLHAEVDGLGRRALEHGPLSALDARRFRDHVAKLAAIYKEHIQIEDEIVFPVAGRLLSESDKRNVAAEMAARRELTN